MKNHSVVFKIRVRQNSFKANFLRGCISASHLLKDGSHETYEETQPRKHDSADCKQQDLLSSQTDTKKLNSPHTAIAS